jgi:hypothetical protein
MTKEQYNEWRNHPATLFFRRFLKDRREQLIGSVTSDWINSGRVDEVNRGRILELFDCEDVTWDIIEEFYPELREKDNEAEVIVTS